MKGESRVEAIVYATNTGSAAQYAEMLAKETGLAAYSLDEAREKFRQTARSSISAG